MNQPPLLYELFESRTVGEHKEQFALSRLIGSLGERPPDSIDGGQMVYRIQLAPYSGNSPYVSDAATRKESIHQGIPTWGAAGFLPIISYKSSDAHLALLYRDSKAPSWPDHYTLASGLSHLIDGVPEPLHATALRELGEELLFLDKRNTDKRTMKEIKIPFRVHCNGQTRVEVYKNEKLVDVVYPFVIGWGTPMDTVTTTVDLCVMFPDRVVNDAVKNLQVINGEIVDRETGRVFSRMTALVNFLDIHERKPKIRIRRFSVNLNENNVNEEYLETRSDEMKYPYYLSLPIEKLKSLTDEELSDLLIV